ncbi:MAG: putative glycoside hydrolase [Eubacterium sp.]
MKKKRFYNNKKRNSKWTEEPKGRKISFSDKYIEAGAGSDKFDNRRPKEKKKVISKDNALTALRRLIIFACCVLTIGIGYTVMDVYMQRNSMPIADNTDDINAGISNVAINIKSCLVPSLSLDGSVMLDTVVDEVLDIGYSSVAFELKREDGTIGYNSSLATVDACGAVSSPSPDLEKSVSSLLENDILPVGIVSCYKDNIAPSADISSAALSAGDIYKDSQGNTYLNPNSEGAYNYIKSIIEEAKGLGITVFVLDWCTLPEELGGDYDDGFENISSRLYNDLGTQIKFIEADKVNIISSDSSEIEEEIDEKIKSKNADDKIYFITAKEKDKVKKLLDDKNISSYIIKE